MFSIVKQLGVAALAAVVTVGVAVPSAHAQFRVLPTSQSLVNPNFQVAPGLPLNQAAFNIAVTGQTFGQVPPFQFGFNPFPPTFTSVVSVSTSSSFFGPGTSIVTTRRVFASGFQPGFRPIGFQPGFGGFFDPSFQSGFQRGFQPGFQPIGFQPGFQRGFRPGFQSGFGPSFRGR